MAMNGPTMRLAVVLAFALGAVACIVWFVVTRSGFALLASIFLSVQAALLFWMSRLRSQLEKK